MRERRPTEGEDGSRSVMPIVVGEGVVARQGEAVHVEGHPGQRGGPGDGGGGRDLHAGVEGSRGQRGMRFHSCCFRSTRPTRGLFLSPSPPVTAGELGGGEGWRDGGGGGEGKERRSL